MRRTAACVALALALAACGGPKVPLQIVGKAVPVDVAFGSDLPDVTVRPIDGGVLIIPDPILPEPLEPFRHPPRPPSKPLACPKASPFAFPEKEATTQIHAAPKRADYSFRMTGTRKVGSVEERLPASEQRQVGNIERIVDPATGADSYRYVVATTSLLEATMTSYLADEDELAIAATSHFRNGTWRSFNPATPLRILPLPPQQTLVLGNSFDSWRSAATDAVTQTTVTVEGRAIDRARVNACGAIVDSWLAELKMHWVSPVDDYETTWRINVATQYGGLLVSESATSTGTRDSQRFEETKLATINQVPRG